MRRSVLFTNHGNQEQGQVKHGNLQRKGALSKGPNKDPKRLLESQLTFNTTLKAVWKTVKIEFLGNQLSVAECSVAQSFALWVGI